MKTALIAIATVYVILQAAVPMLQSWELPQGEISNANQAAQLEVIE